VLGCALSHIRAWRRLASSEGGAGADPNDACLILEDDALPEPILRQRWEEQLWPRLQADWSWRAVWLGGLDLHLHELYGDTLVYQHQGVGVGVGVRRFSGVPRSRGAGAFAYVLRRKGAEELLRAVEAEGMQQAVDWFLFGRFASMPCYYLQPPLASAPAGPFRDSDNTEEYPPTRLLLPTGPQQPPPPQAPRFSLGIEHPKALATGLEPELQEGRMLDVRVELLLQDPSFSSRRAAAWLQDARLCVQTHRQHVPVCQGAAASGPLQVRLEGAAGAEGRREMQLQVTLVNGAGQVMEGGLAYTSVMLRHRRRPDAPRLVQVGSFETLKQTCGPRVGDAASMRACMLSELRGRKQKR
jgi:GR25 family glycosyltransferase involved in LPS biosynthesis